MEDYILRIEVSRWLDWRSALNRFHNVGYHWVSQTQDKWHDEYFWSEGARVLYLDTRYKTITRGSMVDPYKLGVKVGIKDIKGR